MNLTINRSSLINSKTLLFCLFILFAGMSTGVFFTFLIPSEDKLHLAALLQSALETGNLKVVPLLLCNFIWLALMFLSGLTIYGFPLAPVMLFCRAMTLGVCIPLAGASQVLSTLSLFIFNLLFTIVLLAASIFSLSYAMPLIHSQVPSENSHREYCKLFAVLTAFTALLSIFESVVL